MRMIYHRKRTGTQGVRRIIDNFVQEEDFQAVRINMPSLPSHPKRCHGVGNIHIHLITHPSIFSEVVSRCMISRNIDYVVRIIAMFIYYCTSLTTSSLILFYTSLFKVENAVAFRIRALFSVVTCAPWLLCFGIRLAIQNEHLVYSKVPGSVTVNIGTHASHIDGLSMMVAYYRARQFRHPPCAIVKREVLFTPFYGIFAYLVGNVLVSRSSSKQSAVSSMRRVGERARQGFAIGAFPEGTRRRTPSVGKEHLMPFKKGVFHMIKGLMEEGVPVTIAPFCLIGSRSAWPKGRLIPTPGAMVTLKFLPHYQVKGTESIEDLLDTTRSMIENGIEETAKTSKNVYSVEKAFNEAVEIDLKKEFLVDSILLTLPPLITVCLGITGLF